MNAILNILLKTLEIALWTFGGLVVATGMVLAANLATW